ncbi:hypothetical protein [Micromonospora ureilytica]|uniref:hypothetical protein n=1 Tax=Micromonospora ureilytica TaxID=709868 RepID=UPI000F602FA2|nr:hypothetical protein [Micromonospora ureilytica]
MTWLQFVSSVVKSAAWPLTVVAVVLILRRKLNDLLGKGLTRLKAGPVEAEWAILTEEARAGFEAESTSDPTEEQGESDETQGALRRLRDVASLSPALGVIGGFHLVEGAVRDLATPHLPPEAGYRRIRTIRDDLSVLVTRGILGASSGNAIEDMRQLRNIANHAKDFPGRTITQDEAFEYLDLVEDALRLLEGSQKIQERSKG